MPDLNFSSCIPKEPLIKFASEGTAPIVNYNLPTETCFDVVSYVELKINYEAFPTSVKQEPRKNFWESTANMPLEQIIRYIKDSKNTPRNSVFLNPELLSKALEKHEIEDENKEVKRYKNPPQKQYVETICGETYEEIGQKISDGYRPILYKDNYGLVRLRYEPKPDAKPRILLAMRYKMYSFLGDYGAGRTVQTFSLFPGEKTSITVRTYQKNEEVKKKSEHVLDSYSESSAEDLQNQLSHESVYSNTSTLADTSGSSSSNTFGSNNTSNSMSGMTGSLSASGGFEIPLVCEINVSGSLSMNSSSSSQSGTNIANTSGTNNSHTLSTAIGDSIKTLESAVNHHVATANHTRTVDINVESTSTSITEREETVVRQLENVNKSRVLNLVFRQLQQEFITLTYLNDVSIIFTNGYPEQQRMTNLQGLDMFLMDIFENDATKIEEFKHTLFTYLCSIYDYTGTKVGFIEQISEDLSNCIDPIAPSETVTYVRKRKDLQQTYHGKTVNGIILSAVSRITNTPAVIVDALLGQGEALDCYNMRLQDAAAINANLQNDKLAKEITLIDEQKAKLQAENAKLTLQNQQLTQAIAVIDGISDPVEKVKSYKKVFTECCDVPQNGCCCGKCSENAETPDNSGVSAGGN